MHKENGDRPFLVPVYIIIKKSCPLNLIEALMIYTDVLIFGMLGLEVIIRSQQLSAETHSLDALFVKFLCRYLK